jgi:general secretion pathway protein G
MMKKDSKLKKEVLAELERDPALNASHIGVAVNEGVVLLTGHLDTFAEKQAARKAVQRGLSAGFTLIELMVVLVIIGVLAALIVPNVLERADDARATAAKTDVNNLMQALKLYRLDNQRYPTAEQGLQALLTKPTTGAIPTNWKSYLDKLPNDPWGRPYQYLNPGVKGEIDVMSFGADGQPGGEGKNADVGSWD